MYCEDEIKIFLDDGNRLAEQLEENKALKATGKRGKHIITIIMHSKI